MKSSATLLCLALGVFSPRLAAAENATVGELLQAVTAPSVVGKSWIVIPLAGSGIGQTGTVFNADVAITGSHAYYNEQRFALAWLPLGHVSSADAVQYVTLPAEFDQLVTVTNFFGSLGFGAIVIAAVDANGALDPLGEVRAAVRIWSASTCAGETSLAYRAGHWLDADRGTAVGMNLGNGFRTNVGIVNGDAVSHQWHIRYTFLDNGSSADMEVTVAASSSEIFGLPPNSSGPISLTVEAEDTGFPWTGWAASVDNASDDAWYSSLIPF